MDSILVTEKEELGDVLLVFSARDTEKGKFTFYSILEGYDANIIFVNDYSNGWFLKGTPEFESEQEFLAFLRARLQELLKPETGRLFTVGSNMGAYAALKYGALLGADKIIAMGPESELCVPLGRSITSLPNHKEGDGDISELEFKNPSGVYIFSGSNDIVDYYCACKLARGNPQFSVNIITNRTHVVAKYLNAKFGLRNIINSIFIQNDDSFLKDADIGLVLPVDIATDIKLFNQQFNNGVVDTSLSESIDKGVEMYPQWSMIHYFQALVQEQNKNIEGAMASLRAALQAQNTLGRARMRLATLLCSKQDYTAAKDELDILFQNNRSHSVTILLASVQEKLGDIDGAISTLQQSALVETNNKYRIKLESSLHALYNEKHKDFFNPRQQRYLELARSVIEALDVVSDNYTDLAAQPSDQIQAARLFGNKIFYKKPHHSAEISITFVNSKCSRVYVGEDVAGRINIRVSGNDCIVYIGNGARLKEIEIAANLDEGIVVVGNQVTAMPRNVWAGGGGLVEQRAPLIIGDDCMFSYDVCLLSADGHPVFEPQTMELLNAPTNELLIEPHVWFGRGVTVLKNSHIGTCSIVGAGSLVSGRLPHLSVAYGVPAVSQPQPAGLWARTPALKDIEQARVYFMRCSGDAAHIGTMPGDVDIVEPELVQ